MLLLSWHNKPVNNLLTIQNMGVREGGALLLLIHSDISQEIMMNLFRIELKCHLDNPRYLDRVPIMWPFLSAFSH